MATKPGFLSDWPWQRMGNYKYALYAPYAAAAAYHWGCEGDSGDFVAYNAHIGAIAALRYVIMQIWTSVARFPWLVGKYQISSKGIDFKQVDREDSWDDFILFNSMGLSLLGLVLPGWQSLPLLNGHGLVVMLLLHASVAEWLYYWFHRALHHHWLYTRYHSHHHQSFVTEPISGSVHPFLEHVGYIAIFAMPGVLTYVGGQGSIAMIYAYLLTFDFLNGLGHCNFEFIPTALFKTFPLLKYLIYTPSYHSLHHTRVHTNFSLFMPLYDYLYGTVDRDSDTLHETTVKGMHPGPSAIFLAHGIDLGSFVHGCFGLRGLAAHPYCPTWVVYPFLPLATFVTLFLWLIDAKPWAVDRRSLRGHKLELWSVPRLGLQYFMKSERPTINRLILKSIKECDANGVQVFGLGALNKSEALNQGGEIYRDDVEGMRMRVVHGNTLTAAVILNRLPADCDEVFLTGGTSKLGRALALYLIRKNVRVLLHTRSQERFQVILNEAAPEHRPNLVWSPDLTDGAHCKNWVVGRWHSAKEQAVAPPGTHFHQFVVPLMTPARKDCTYSRQTCLRMPKDTQGLAHCELNLDRNTVHACHAAVIVHLLEGWDFHELGSINVDRIDENWEAALKHGFIPVP